MIGRETIDRVFDAVQITDVVQEFVSLKKKGANYWGRCPFHDEKTPSFSVSPTKNIFKCFGCGEGGNAVNFLMKAESMTYIEAIKWLAQKYNIEIKETLASEQDIQEKNNRESMMILTQYAQRVFANNLFNTQQGQAIGLSYFKERGYREDIIRKFGLGYSLPERDAFYKLARKDGYKEEFLLQTGLCLKGEHGVYDRFFDRAMFPVHDLMGKVIAFGGRILKNDTKAAKYQNSPESDIYQKRKSLYGIFQAKKAILQHDMCFLVEGYFDVLGMHQAGFEHTVASSGTSLTKEQINLIKRFTPNVTVLYDGDAAGIKGALRGIDLMLEQGLNVKVLLLPEGEDPDSFAKSHSTTEFSDYINQHQTDFITFKTKFLLEEAKADPFKRAQMITDVVRSISLIPDGIIRSVCIKDCSRMLDTDEKMLVFEVSKRRRAYLESLYKNQVEPTPSVEPEYSPDSEMVDVSVSNKRDLDIAERDIIRLMVVYGSNKMMFDGNEYSVVEFLVNEIESDELSWRNRLFHDLYIEIRDNYQKGILLDSKHFITHNNPIISKLTADFLSTPHSLSALWKKNEIYARTELLELNDLVPKSLYVLKSTKVMDMLKELNANLSVVEDRERQIELLSRYNALNEVKKELAKTLGERVIL